MATPVWRTESCSSVTGSRVTHRRSVACGSGGCCRQGAPRAYHATDRPLASYSPVGRYQCVRVSGLFR